VNALVSLDTTFGALGALMNPAPLSAPRAWSGIVVPIVPNSSTAPAGFVNLINLLLGSAVSDPQPDSTTNLETHSITQDEPVDAETAPSPQLIADALIRSMLNRSLLNGSMLNLSMPNRPMPNPPLPDAAPSPTPAPLTNMLAGRIPVQTPTVTRKERTATPAAAQSQTAPIGGALVVIDPVTVELAAPVPSPPISSPATTKASESASIQAGNSRIVQQPAPHGESAAPPPTGVKPELAFSLRLTPVENLKIDVSEDPGKPMAELPAKTVPQAQSQPQPPSADSLDGVESNVTTAAAAVLPPVAPQAALPPAGVTLAKPAAPKGAASRQPPAPPATSTAANTRPIPEAPQETVPAVTAVAESAPTGDHTASFARALELASPPASPTSSANPAEHAPQTATEALRASEPVVPLESPAPPSAAQGIAVRIALPDTPHVDVQFVDRAGQVQVAVRSPDTGLQSSLRQDLGTLVNSLERSGFHTEAFTPHGVIEQAGASSQMNFQDNGRQHDPGSGEQGHPSGNASGGSRDGQQEPQQQGQQRRRSRQWQAWTETMENAA
jgi:hypothetical protein